MDFDVFLESLTEDELKFIADRDYGVDSDLHLEALRKVVGEQAGAFTEQQSWYPYEVIELGAHALVPGHEREFVACTLLVLRAVATGYDRSTQLDWKFSDHTQDYDALPPALKQAVLDAYVQAEC